MAQIFVFLVYFDIQHDNTPPAFLTRNVRNLSLSSCILDQIQRKGVQKIRSTQRLYEDISKLEKVNSHGKKPCVYGKKLLLQLKTFKNKFFREFLFKQGYMKASTYFLNRISAGLLPGNFQNHTLLFKNNAFFNSASVLLNFFINWASNVAQVLLNTYNNHYTETHFIFSIFVFMSRPMSIYAVCM